MFRKQFLGIDRACFKSFVWKKEHVLTSVWSRSLSSFTGVGTSSDSGIRKHIFFSGNSIIVIFCFMIKEEFFDNPKVVQMLVFHLHEKINFVSTMNMSPLSFLVKGSWSCSALFQLAKRILIKTCHAIIFVIKNTRYLGSFSPRLLIFSMIILCL